MDGPLPLVHLDPVVRPTSGRRRSIGVEAGVEHGDHHIGVPVVCFQAAATPIGVRSVSSEKEGSFESPEVSQPKRWSGTAAEVAEGPRGNRTWRQAEQHGERHALRDAGCAVGGRLPQ